MNLLQEPIQQPIQIAPEVLRCLPPQVAASLLSGCRLQLPGPMVWHEWGRECLDQGASTLVLLHGGSGSWMHWIRNIAPLVADGFHVLAVDLPGFGDSALPGYTQEDPKKTYLLTLLLCAERIVLFCIVILLIKNSTGYLIFAAMPPTRAAAPIIVFGLILLKYLFN